MHTTTLQRYIGALVLALLSTLGLAGCGGTASDDGRPTVVATTTMIADAARVIGGGDVRVIPIMKEGQDPHGYKVMPRDATAIAEADLVLMNGLHLEATLTHIIDESAEGTVVRLAEHDDIDPIRPEGGASAAPDPHCWMDVQNFKRYAEGIRDALIKLDPENAEGYRERAAAYIAELETLDAWVSEQVATVPEARRVMISSHDAFGYYGRAYDLEVHGVAGISTEGDISPGRIQFLEELIAQRGITTVFHETSVRDSLNNAVMGIAEHTDAEISEAQLFSDSLGAEGTPGGTYIGMIRHNTTTIVEALRGDG